MGTTSQACHPHIGYGAPYGALECTQDTSFWDGTIAHRRGCPLLSTNLFPSYLTITVDAEQHGEAAIENLTQQNMPSSFFRLRSNEPDPASATYIVDSCEKLHMSVQHKRTQLFTKDYFRVGSASESVQIQQRETHGLSRISADKKP